MKIKICLIAIVTTMFNLTLLAQRSANFKYTDPNGIVIEVKEFNLYPAELDSTVMIKYISSDLLFKTVDTATYNYYISIWECKLNEKTNKFNIRIHSNLRPKVSDGHVWFQNPCLWEFSIRDGKIYEWKLLYCEL